jgi:hypothetical protein
MLIEAARLGNEPMLQAVLKRIVPQYAPPSEAPIFETRQALGTGAQGSLERANPRPS